MLIKKTTNGFDVWWGDGKLKWKTISISYHLRHFLCFDCYTNGAVKGVDRCFDWNLHLFGLFISYTDWCYGRFIKPNNKTDYKGVNKWHLKWP